MTARKILTEALGLSLLLFACGQQDVRKPPDITEPSRAQTMILRSYEAPGFTLQCTADGRPKPTYTWYLNDKLVENSKRISVDGNTGLLAIKDFSAHDDGLYKCHVNVTFAKNRWAVAVSPVIDVQLARLEIWPSGGKDWKAEREVGSYLLVPCEDIRPESHGETEYKWETFGSGEVIDDLNHFIDSNGDLHIFFLKADKATYKFYCGVSNFLASYQTFGRTATVAVRTTAGPFNRKPVLRHATGLHNVTQLTFEMRSDARLECVISGYVSDPTATNINLMTSLPKITWLNDRNQTIVSGQGRHTITNYGRVLTIKNLVESDETKYTCLGTSKLGRAEATLSINVTSVPIWVKTLNSMTVTQGQDALLHCQTRSAKSEQPPSTPTWYRNGLRFNFDYDPKKYHFSDEMRALNVTSAQKLTDIACFQCFVSNSVGQVVGAACLNVILPMEIITRPKGSQVVDRATDVDLTVVARSDPLTPLTYVWYFKNKTYSTDDPPPHVEYNATTKLAVIRTRKLTDDEMRDIGGVYTREIFNRFQRETVETKVITSETTGDACTDGFFGPRCITCGKCLNAEPCDKITGECKACEPGYQLPYCGGGEAVRSGLASSLGNLGMIIIFACVIAALLLSLILAKVFLMRKKKKSRAAREASELHSVPQFRPSVGAMEPSMPSFTSTEVVPTDTSTFGESMVSDTDYTTSEYTERETGSVV